MQKKHGLVGRCVPGTSTRCSERGHTNEIFKYIPNSYFGPFCSLGFVVSSLTHAGLNRVKSSGAIPAGKEGIGEACQMVRGSKKQLSPEYQP